LPITMRVAGAGGNRAADEHFGVRLRVGHAALLACCDVVCCGLRPPVATRSKDRQAACPSCHERRRSRWSAQAEIANGIANRTGKPSGSTGSNPRYRTGKPSGSTGSNPRYRTGKPSGSTGSNPRYRTGKPSGSTGSKPRYRTGKPRESAGGDRDRLMRTRPSQRNETTATRHRNPTPQPDIATTDAGTRRTSRNVGLDLKQQRRRRQVVSGLTTEHVRRQVQTGLHGSVSRIPDGRSPSHASESRPNRARAEIQSRLRQSAESHHRLIDDAALPQRPTRQAPRESRPQSRSSAIFPAEPSQVGA
jgi:hypothetical protein